MRIFRKLFGRKESGKDSDMDESISQVKTSEIPVSEQIINDSANQTAEEFSKNYDLAEIKKESTRIKNEQGYLASITYIKNFISNTKIEFKEFISLMKKTIPYMLKESTLSKGDILNYLSKTIDIFLEKDDIQSITHIAELYHRLDLKYALNYLESKIGSYEENTKAEIDHFDSLILLSDYYLQDKQPDAAFVICRRAALLLTNVHDKYHYITKQMTIAQRQSKICLEGYTKPVYGNYLYFEILSFFLKVAYDLNSFPYLSFYFEFKNNCLNHKCYFKGNQDFRIALEALGINTKETEIISDLYQFAFEEIPRIMNIPEAMLIENTLEEILSNNEISDEKMEERIKIINLSIQLSNERFYDHPLHVNIKKIMKRYIQ